MDPNCSEAAILDHPVCGLCASGFKLNEFLVCEPIGASAEMIKRCLLIDPENKDVCLICNQNYYMDRTGACRLGNIREFAYTNPIWYQVSASGMAVAGLTLILSMILS
jgi:hypothetical protein